MVIKNTMEQYDSKHNKTWRIRERADESMQGEMQKLREKKGERKDRYNLKRTSCQSRAERNAGWGSLT